MQSDQEALIYQLIERSLGGFALFIPHKWKKGNGVREPADAVWLLNNVVVFFYFHETAKSSAEADRVIEHNLKQAKGCLRLWRMGSQLLAKTHIKHSASPILQTHTLLYFLSSSVIVQSQLIITITHDHYLYLRVLLYPSNY